MSCDSLVALGNSTRDGATLFARNSDRPAAECQPLVQIPRREHPPGSRVRCQYIEIPQVAGTARMIGSRPFWLWGFEHGLNEHGVAIGNHTVFSKDTLPSPGLIGMDLVRLGLERAATARAAAAVIAGLVELYGQGGSGYFDKDWPYHNSFLIADAHEAYLLETSDRRWALRRIRDMGSASNHLTIGTDWDSLSPDLVGHAVTEGWWRPAGEQRFDFAGAYRDTSVAPPVISSGRHRRTCELLARNRGRWSPAALQSALRDHYDGLFPDPRRVPDDERYFAVCMHAEPVGTTTASMVARLPSDSDDLLRYWGSFGSPCVGTFLPYYIDGDIPSVLARGGEVPSDDSPWWLFNHLLGLVARDWERYAARVRAEWDEFERAVAARTEAIETEVIDHRRRGRPEVAAEVLKRFMAVNVNEMLERLRRLVSELSDR